MCFNIISYVEWACAYRQNTGRQHLDCRRTICRLSDHHKTEVHDCDKTCVGTATSEQHIVTDTYQAVCLHCEKAGRKEHPGVKQVQEDGASSGGIPYRYLVG
ncbi:hypothetical protein L226DRAFT_533783 [Lentinus tigrinus ALCF2SS1-7]|uniref:Uncharacterized protein n=1 Tax=Lentinus tigrinus ALCF2SS1-6 TaxID=1328759 RepID=A0A5C2SL68_9APHY|nr:hypothetical protein L227DRAFT_572057 [Lentinus tigrinus ALCF2SS1-6]RPD76728.1 hypothetical protein L226DRAFT_533783 [Lentinus tigrinus ALCF2SS1-7]